ncbi:MAG: repair protein RecN [Actinomycetota bacterium]
MIEEIYIRDLGVIKEARLGFGKGFTVITGETGAGKTMVLSAFGLLLGERSDSTAIRQGQAEAYVEGRWQISQDSAVAERVLEAGGAISDGELLVNRSVSNEGRSRAAVGGRSVPVSLLGEVGGSLVVVHGQSDQIRLRSTTAQREALDKFAGEALASKLAEYRTAFLKHRELAAQLADLKQNLASRIAAAEALREAVEELERIDPQVGELDELANTATRLSHIEELRIAVAGAHEALLTDTDGVDAVTLLGTARRSLEHVSDHDSALAVHAETIKQLGYALNDVAAELSGYIDGLEGNSAVELERVQSRRAELNALVRKYGTYEEVVEYRDKASKELMLIDNSDGVIEQLEAEVEAAKAVRDGLADDIHALRTQASIALAEEVTGELAGLAMSGASLVVNVTKSNEYFEHGADEIAIMLSAYPGAEPRALGKGASGGELSRIMLAIEVVLARGGDVPTFIFDEVDAGVGGAAAIEVGRRLAKLSQQAQVIVVTHLAQVAAYADNHLRVLKSMNSEYTVSDVVTLTGGDRVEELARMLSGLSDSGAARIHAHEMLVRASSEFGSQN